MSKANLPEKPVFTAPYSVDENQLGQRLAYLRRHGWLTCNFRAAVKTSRWLLSLATLSLPGYAEAQLDPSTRSSTLVVQGRVTETSGLAVEGAQLTLRGGSARAETSADGKFRVTLNIAPSDTAGWIYVRRIGFRPDSARVGITASSTANLSIVLERAAVPIAPVVVSSRRTFDGPMAGFHKRKESSSGRFFTSSDINKRNPARLSDLFRMVPGFRVANANTAPSSMRIRGSRCSPQFWLDGQPLSGVIEFDFDAFDPRSFEGIEIYSGPASVPVEFQRDRFGSSSCGTILLWSKRGERRTTVKKKLEISPASEVASMVEKNAVFTDRDVDSPAFPDSLSLVRPSYPDSLFQAKVGGSVLVEFVVNDSGKVQPETFSVVTATHRDFIEPVREAILQQRYIPARRGGRNVSQVVQQPFEFTPEKRGSPL